MIKHYCDCCGEEIKDDEKTISITPDKFSYHREVTIKLSSIVDLFNYQLTEIKHICKYCIVKAVQRLDDRPKAHVEPCVKCIDKPSEIAAANQLEWAK